MTDQDQRDNMDEQEEPLVVLQDENGNDMNFEHLMTLQYKGASYILLEAQQDMEDCLQGESIILKIEQDENGDDIYATIEDEEEYQAVFEQCLEALDDDGEDDEDGDDGEQ